MVTLPEIDYETDENGNIIIVLPPGTDEEDINVMLLTPEWEYEIIVDEDDNLVITTPPSEEENGVGKKDKIQSTNQTQLPQIGSAITQAISGGLLLSTTGILVARKKKKNITA